MKNSARFLSLLMMVVLMLMQMPVKAAAEEEQPPQECTAVMVIAVDEQSHTVGCSDCGASVTEAHSFGDWRMQDAQCHVRVCTCGASVTEAHTWDNGVVAEASGTRTYTCTACAATFTEKVVPSEDGEGENPVDEETLRNPADCLIGDVDGDGQVTTKDLDIVIDISFGKLPSATELPLKAADVNHDNWVDADDIVCLYAMLIG